MSYSFRITAAQASAPRSREEQDDQAVLLDRDLNIVHTNRAMTSLGLGDSGSEVMKELVATHL